MSIAASRDGGKSFGPTVVITSLIDPVPGLLPNSNYRVFSDVYSQADADGNVTAVFNDERSGHSAVYAVRTLHPGDISSWSSPTLVKASSGEQFFPWISAAPSGRLDLAFYDRGHDPNDTLNWVDYNASTNDGATWTETDATTSGANLDKYQACLAFVQPSNCGVFFIGDYMCVSLVTVGWRRPQIQCAPVGWVPLTDLTKTGCDGVGSIESPPMTKYE